MSVCLPFDLPGYHLRQGSTLDRPLLFKFLHRTYQELFPNQNLAHLAQTVEYYLSPKTPLWWVETRSIPDMSTDNSSDNFPDNSPDHSPDHSPDIPSPPAPESVEFTGLPGLHSRARAIATPIATLWMGVAVDQVEGDRHSHIFLIYVDPKHRRRGIGSGLLATAEAWAKSQGDRQLTLQVFCNNLAALNLYQKRGYHPQTLNLVKQL